MKSNFFATTAGIVVTGALIGVLAVVLQLNGNPPNMGICVACFERDIAGALGLQRAAIVQYLRPEIIGLCWVRSVPLWPSAISRPAEAPLPLPVSCWA